MRMAHAISTSLIFILAACGQAAAPGNAEAQPAAQAGAPAATTAAVTDAEKAGILAAMQMHADARGLVMNECNDRVAPQYIPVDVGLGRTVLFVMVGGPNGGYSCYGDGPGLWLMRNVGGAWRQIYTSRGGYMVVMPATHNGAHDLVFGGPGFTHASSRWTGSAYGPGPDVSDEQLAQGVTLPN